jgi:twitching motility protein PilT
MQGAEMLDRVVSLARERGGYRLDLVADRPATLTTARGRLQAGGAVPDAEALRNWLQTLMPEERWVAFELGQEVEFAADVAGRKHVLYANQAGGIVRVAVLLGEAVAVAGGGAHIPASPGVPAEQARGTPEPVGRAVERPLDRMLHRLVDMGGSDLHLTAGCAPLIRMYGDMAAMPGVDAPLSSEHVLLMCEEIAPAANRQEFREENDTDFAYEIADLARFRVNLFRDRRGVCAVFRQIPSRILTMEELGLPDCVRTLCMMRKGLVLVTGPTGSGKSTTLATMVDFINANRDEHIITIEDPIEFVHENKRCLVNQREVHAHTESFRRALRAALREDPDIVLVGELRDLETMAIAVETAETGHLVLGTLHTTTAVSTVDRLIDQFPPDRQEQIRVMVSESLKGVIAQILLKRKGGGRVAAYEILLGIPAVANLIREGKTFQIASIMQTNKRLGMQLLNDALADLVRREVVDVDEAVAKAVDKDGLRATLKIDKTAGNGASSAPGVRSQGSGLRER